MSNCKKTGSVLLGIAIGAALSSAVRCCCGGNPSKELRRKVKELSELVDAAGSVFKD